MSLLDEATAIIVARQQQYDLIVADFYFMAVLSGDQEEALHIWEEAWEEGTNELVVLLLWAETQAELVRASEGK